MKTLIFLSLAVFSVQAVDWSQVKPRYAFKEPTRSSIKADRIIGGEVAAPGQFPFQAGIFLDDSGFCGGTLISDTVVMTAAHCCDKTITYDVHLGAHFIYNEDEPNHQVIRSTDALMHENYNASTLNNDICIVRLPSAVSGPDVGTVQLPSRSMVGDALNGTNATSSGWGRPKDSNPSLSPVLKWVDATILENKKCDFTSIITDCHMCIGTAAGTVGICNGDFGGPLSITESDGTRTQIGISSFTASSGCQYGTPHVYCRLTCYLNWLEQHAGVTIRP